MINKKQLNSEDIMALLPHRYPFLMIDKVLDWESGKKLIALKNVTINEPFFQGHFPTSPVMPGVLILEGAAQAGGVLFLLSNPNDGEGERITYFMSADEVKFRRMVVPGDTLIFDVDVISNRSKISKCSCKATVNGELVFQSIITAMCDIKK